MTQSFWRQNNCSENSSEMLKYSVKCSNQDLHTPLKEEFSIIEDTVSLQVKNEMGK